MMSDREKVLTWLEICGKDRDCSGTCPYSENGFGEYGQCRESLMADAYDLLKEQEEEINNYKETIENLLQQLQDIGKYMTPLGMVSDVRAYIEGRSQPEIIRCYACKHGQNEEWDNGECVDRTVYCDGYGIHKPDWFCADGQRKDSE